MPCPALIPIIVSGPSNKVGGGRVLRVIFRESRSGPQASLAKTWEATSSLHTFKAQADAPGGLLDLMVAAY